MFVRVCFISLIRSIWKWGAGSLFKNFLACLHMFFLNVYSVHCTVKFVCIGEILFQYLTDVLLIQIDEAFLYRVEHWICFEFNRFVIVYCCHVVHNAAGIFFRYSFNWLCKICYDTHPLSVNASCLT